MSKALTYWEELIEPSLNSITVNHKKDTKTNSPFSSLDSIETFKSRFLEVIKETDSLETIRDKVRKFIDDVLLPFLDKKADRLSTTYQGCTISGKAIELKKAKVKQLSVSIKTALNEAVAKERSITTSDISEVLKKFV